MGNRARRVSVVSDPRHYLDQRIPASRAALLVKHAKASIDHNPGIPRGDVRRALITLNSCLGQFEEAPADRLLQRLIEVFSPAVVLRDVVLPYLRDTGQCCGRGEATSAQEHYTACFLERWMLGLPRGGPRPADGTRSWRALPVNTTSWD